MSISVQEFATKYKAKNPQFSKMGDLEVAQMVARNYPEWKNKIDFSGVKEPVKPVVQQQIQQQPKEKSLLQKGSEAVDKALGTASDVMFSTAGKSIGGLITRGIGGVKTITGEITGNEQMKQEGLKLQEVGKPTKTDIVFTALELYPGGGMLTGALKKLPGGKAIAEALSHVPEGVRANAIKQYSEALGATTKELKSKTTKVVGELLDRRVSGGLEKISGLADEGTEVGGDAVKKAGDNLPVFAKTKVKPIIEKAKKLRNSYIVNGKVLDEGAINSIDKVVETITQFGKEIPDPQLLKIRRVLDKSVAIGNKNFTKEEGVSLAVEAKEGMANSIRNVLNSKYPELGAANKEFALWSNVHKIVTATLERRSTQSGGITKFIAPIMAGGAGFAGGGGAPAIIGYFATQQAIKLFQSPAYKTLSAVNKARLADYLASGKIKEATLYTAKLLNGLKNANTK
jgi:uncharacterized protein YjbJ (UPF0337 family)